MTDNDRVNLLEWYRANRRPLPWRENRDPYRIWISEVMLQQTTVEAVKPYYARFLERFPNLEALAAAPLSDVLEKWAGLGYYSRARNLHKAAQALASLPQFPRTYKELLELPGFGPYTARAVSSIAFGEKVGVIDGNVIRVLSRKTATGYQWWQPAEREKLQKLVDEFVAPGPSEELNQALMELGATICTPQSAKCMLCPWLQSCEGRKRDKVDSLPLKKEKRAKEIWLWQPVLHFDRKGRLLFVKNEKGPFLRNQMLPPGRFTKLKKRPRTYDLRHSITHHDIFIDVQRAQKGKITDGQWFSLDEVAKTSPFSILKKVIQKGLPNESMASSRRTVRTQRLQKRTTTRR